METQTRREQSARRTVAAACLLALFTACSGGGDPSVSADDLSRTVLQETDLPAVFVQFDEGRLTGRESPLGDAGWKARYRRAGSAATRGPLVVAARVDRFQDAEAAAKAFASFRRQLYAAEGAARLDAPTVGEETAAIRIRQEGLNSVDFFTVAWREANVIASVLVNGFARKVTLTDAVALAQKQQRRIADVADA